MGAPHIIWRKRLTQHDALWHKQPVDVISQHEHICISVSTYVYVFSRCCAQTSRVSKAAGMKNSGINLPHSVCLWTRFDLSMQLIHFPAHLMMFISVGITWLVEDCTGNACKGLAWATPWGPNRIFKAPFSVGNNFTHCISHPSQLTHLL